MAKRRIVKSKAEKIIENTTKETMEIHCLYDKLVNIKDLKPHPNNYNKHPKRTYTFFTFIFSAFILLRFDLCLRSHHGEQHLLIEFLCGF